MCSRRSRRRVAWPTPTSASSARWGCWLEACTRCARLDNACRASSSEALRRSASYRTAHCLLLPGRAAAAMAQAAARAGGWLPALACGAAEHSSAAVPCSKGGGISSPHQPGPAWSLCAAGPRLAGCVGGRSLPRAVRGSSPPLCAAAAAVRGGAGAGACRAAGSGARGVLGQPGGSGKRGQRQQGGQPRRARQRSSSQRSGGSGGAGSGSGSRAGGGSREQRV